MLESDLNHVHRLPELQHSPDIGQVDKIEPLTKAYFRKPVGLPLRKIYETEIHLLTSCLEFSNRISRELLPSPAPAAIFSA